MKTVLTMKTITNNIKPKELNMINIGGYGAKRNQCENALWNEVESPVVLVSLSVFLKVTIIDSHYVNKCAATHCNHKICCVGLTDKCDPHWQSRAVNTEVLQNVVSHETQDGEARSITCMVDLQKDRLKFNSNR